MSPFLFRTDMPVDSAAGLFIVGAGNTTMPDDARASNPVLGLLLVLAGSCAFSLKNVLVERLFQSDEQPLSVLETTGISVRKRKGDMRTDCSIAGQAAHLAPTTFHMRGARVDFGPGTICSKRP